MVGGEDDKGERSKRRGVVDGGMDDKEERSKRRGVIDGGVDDKEERGEWEWWMSRRWKM